tara:strand:+ start:16 stop:1923 length:1908 start_codon:yes stop_codon:yes gene_type:complete
MSINKIKNTYDNKRAFTTRPDRAIEMGGFAPSATKDGSSIQMASSGTSTDFGDLTNNRTLAGGMTASSVTRALFYGGEVPGANSTDVDSFELASTGNAADFGDLAVARGYSAATSNGTRAISAGGVTPVINNIDFASIAQMGNFTDFGDLTVSRNSLVGICSPVRGVFAGGTDGTSPSPAFKNDIDYITINSTGNATDFGDLTGTSGYMSVTNDSSGKGFFIGGQGSPSTKNSEATDLITIATTGNATEFGTLTQRTKVAASACQGTTGFTLGGANPSYNNVVQRFIMPSLGNMTDFGDLNISKGDNKGACGSHDGIDWGSIGVQRPSVIYMPGSGRGFTNAGTNSGGSAGSINRIQLTHIPTLGNAVDFGNLNSSRQLPGSTSSVTRSCVAGGEAPSGIINVIDTYEHASLGNAADFGDLSVSRRNLPGGGSNGTRGTFNGGNTPSRSDVIDYITIASAGNATDFGNLTTATEGKSACSSPTRTVCMGGYKDSSPNYTAEIDYYTTASTGNASDFGDMTEGRSLGAPVSSDTRAVNAGGYTSSRTVTIDYITIASTGNSTDFGDLPSGFGAAASGLSNNVRGLFAGGEVPGTDSAQINFVTIASTGNTADFGDLVEACQYTSGTSDSHGGLQSA